MSDAFRVLEGALNDYVEVTVKNIGVDEEIHEKISNREVEGILDKYSDIGRSNNEGTSYWDFNRIIIRR